MVVGLAMIVIIILMGIIYFLTYHYSEDKNIEKLKDLGYSLQNELILAAEVEVGYERTVSVPDRIGGVDYLISQVNNDLVLTYKQAELLFPTPAVTGSFHKGTNIITKTDVSTIVIT